ncbi:RIMS-binding protein 2-like [Littorina saxatilis]|uniref:RIMS-binding protein 2-like n=1 Tax=Littorina saxatilis TaxID=31220 RepID=UPI0038B4F83F
MESHRDPRSELGLLNDSRLSALANRGPIQVYVAKYSYNPFEYSPNENPEAELQLNAGDYVLVLGDMDEDGFYEGELIEGRRGLVPSNFIEKVSDEDLADFHAALALTGSTDDSNTSAKPGPSPLDSDNEDMTDQNYGINGQFNKNILNNNNNSYEVPHPEHLVLERQLTNSVLISWRPPHGLDPSAIQAYHIYLDGNLKTTLKGSERTKALLEDVDANLNHRVSVRCLSNQGQSKDSQCTMLIGRDVLPVPSDLGVRNVTQSSACIHWTPGNSNCPHAILLNGRELKVVKPGVCQHTLSGLDPASVYRVTIATKPASGTYGERHKWSQDKVSCNIEFKTLVGGSVPDPPLNVQVEAGPREGTLLLTWLPVTINSSGFSNGAVVTGYVVYADGRRIKEVKGPTNDHMVLSGDDFKGSVPKQLTVRTATVDQLESIDSVAVRLPHALVKEVMAGTAHIMASEAARAANLRKVSGVTGDAPAGHETDEEIEAAFQEAENSSPEIEAQIAEPFPESSSSELSDILEVEEELGGEESNQNGDPSLANSHSQDKVHKSPKPAPRKMSPLSPAQSAAEKDAAFTPKQFHGQKPDPSRKDGNLTTPLIVPAIEITRDSSTERGTSFDEDAEGSGSRRPTPPTDSASRQQRQKSVEDSVEKPMPSHDPVIQRYRSSGDEPSAFRSVEQGRPRRTMPETRSPDSARPAEVSESPSRPGSGQRPGSGHSTHSHKAKDEGSRHSTPSHKAKDDHSGHSTPSHKSRDDRSAHSTPSHKAREDRSWSEERLPGSENSNPPPKPARRTPLDPEDVNDRDSIAEEINSAVDDSTVRLFIALFDYDPMTMSPNVDCIDEELPFREGQILKVFGDKDPDGFYRGEADGREGFIPCNMVSEIHIDDPELVEQLLKENQTGSQPNHTGDVKGKGEGHQTSNGVAPLPAQGPVRRMVALYDYDPQELSPNVDAEVELPFKQGEILYIMGDMDEDGFYFGELNGARGLVPSNFLQDAPLSDEDEVLESASMVSPSRSQGSISQASRRSDSLSTLNNVGEGSAECQDSPALHVPAGVLTAHPPIPAGGDSPDVTQGSPVAVAANGASDSPRRAQRQRHQPGGGRGEAQEKGGTTE